MKNLPAAANPHSTAATTRILPGLSAIAPAYDAILSDIWGVVHDGRHHFPAAADALVRYRAGGGKVVLITNAPRPCGPIVAQLEQLGVPRPAYDAIVTSGDATIALIGARGLAPIHHIGPERDLTLFEEARARTGISPALTGLAGAEYVVCTGLFDDDHETPEDYTALLETMLARDVEMICANPDIVVHRGSTLLYCSGALAQKYAGMGGRVALAGKPYAPIYDLALNLTGCRSGRVLAIGDAVATDMLGAQQQQLDALFVTHGIHRDKLHPEGDILLDSPALHGFLRDEAISPLYAMNQLRW